MAARTLSLGGLVALTLALAAAPAAASSDAARGLDAFALVDHVLGTELPAGASPLTDPGAGEPGAGTPPLAPDLTVPEGTWDLSFLALGVAGAFGLAGAAVWGGTRFRGTEEVLQHEVRSQIYRYVDQHIGASLKDITDHLGLSTTNAVWHLRKLEETGLVKGRKFNGAKVYYPTAGGVQARDLSIAGAALTSDNARAILGLVLDRPGVHQREISRLLDINHGTVRWHLKKLRRAELLEERRTGASASYYATPLGDEALRAVQARLAEPARMAQASSQVVSPPAGQA